MKIILLILSSSFIIIGTELLKRKFSFPTAVTRRVIHIGTSAVVGVSAFFVTREELILVSLLFIGILCVGRIYNLFSAIHAVERYSFGDIYLPLGVAVTAFIFLPHNLHAFQFGIFIMGFSDAIGGFIGERYGKHFFTIMGNKKTIEGSMVFFLTSVIVTCIFYPVLGYQVLLFPLILVFVEAISIYGLDNLVLPIVAAFLFDFFI